MHPALNQTDALHHNLKRLAVLRLITCSGVAFALWALGRGSTPDESILSAWAILTLMTLLSLINLWRANHVQGGASLFQQELFIYLLLDTLLIASLIYFTGGANNPFITYLLVPIVISAATLSWFSTWILCVLAMSAYGLLLFIYEPLAALDIVLAQIGLSMHIVGMWLTFILSALFIAYFVFNMAWDLKHASKQAAHFREQSIQNENVMLLASQAASTAHEIGSPLTSLKILAHELSLEKDLSDDAQQDLSLMQKQIDLCQLKLQQLTDQTALHNDAPEQPLHDFINECLQQWLLMNPKGQYQWQKEHVNTPNVQYPLVLQQAIINLLDNAQKASQQAVDLTLSWDNENWQLLIQDFGEGIKDDFELPQKPMASENGLGIGLLLSHSSIQRLGGKVSLQNRLINHEVIGCDTLIKVPLKQMQGLAAMGASYE